MRGPRAAAAAGPLNALSLPPRPLAAAACLEDHGLRMDDACFIELGVRDMAEFRTINGVYCAYFGPNPPSRCVHAPPAAAIAVSPTRGGRTRQVLRRAASAAVRGDGLLHSARGSRRETPSLVQTHCTCPQHKPALSPALQRGREAARSADGHRGALPRRRVLHVQSISHWAPTCIGPYSQVNSVRLTCAGLRVGCP